MSEMDRRKDEHLEITLSGEVEHDRGALLGCVELIHQSLPELALEEVTLGVRLWGRRCAAPLLVTGMTGGSDRARRINHELARVVEAVGLPLGVGSMRPLLRDRARWADYDLRPLAPSIPLLGNLGAVQARELPPDELAGLLDELGYDALCLHLNPAQELAQREGDRDFRGVVAAIARYAEHFGERLVVKETGAGLSPQALDALRGAGVVWVDVSGRGGTSWTKVEARRPDAEAFGGWFGEWGVPTAAATVWAVRRGFRTIASGGIRSVLDVLKVWALGAEVAGIARPVLVRLEAEGAAAVERWLREWLAGLRRGLLLTGARRPRELRAAPRLVTEPLRSWLRLDAEEGTGAP